MATRKQKLAAIKVMTDRMIAGPSEDLEYDLEVGNVIESEFNLHWIGVSPEMAEPVLSPRGKQLVAIKFPRTDIPWLIEALQKELKIAAHSDN